MDQNNVTIRLEKKKNTGKWKTWSEKASGMYTAQGAWSIMCSISFGMIPHL